MTWITTFSGRKFPFFGTPEQMAEVIEIEDIAASLGKLCRYTGHCRHFFSVAEHSVQLSHIVPDEDAFCGLLHDATEAYTNDLAKPLKRELSQYNEIEDRVWQGIALKFGLPVAMPQSVKDADLAMLKREIDLMMPPGTLDTLDLPPGPLAPIARFGHWAPRIAPLRFMDRFRELSLK